MKRFYIVNEDFTSQYKIPVNLVEGEKVKTGERFYDDPDWPGWIWCENQRGEKGWVLERVLKIDYDNATVLENFAIESLKLKRVTNWNYKKAKGDGSGAKIQQENPVGFH